MWKPGATYQDLCVNPLTLSISLAKLLPKTKKAYPGSDKPLILWCRKEESNLRPTNYELPINPYLFFLVVS